MTEKDDVIFYLEPLHGNSQGKNDPWLLVGYTDEVAAYATLHYKQRWWSMGVRADPYPADQVGPYVGRGWESRLRLDATAALLRDIQQREAEVYGSAGMPQQADAGEADA